MGGVGAHGAYDNDRLACFLLVCSMVVCKSAVPRMIVDMFSLMVCANVVFAICMF